MREDQMRKYLCVVDWIAAEVLLSAADNASVGEELRRYLGCLLGDVQQAVVTKEKALKQQDTGGGRCEHASG